MSEPSKTRLSPSGQPVQGTWIDVQLEDLSWVPAQVVGKMFGKKGSADLIALIVEADGLGRSHTPWPHPFCRTRT